MSNELLRDLEAVDADPFEITNRDRALFLIEEYDLEAQLLAIRSLLKRNSESDKGLEAEIKALEAEIRRHNGRVRRLPAGLEDRAPTWLRIPRCRT